MIICHRKIFVLEMEVHALFMGLFPLSQHFEKSKMLVKWEETSMHMYIHSILKE